MTFARLVSVPADKVRMPTSTVVITPDSTIGFEISEARDPPKSAITLKHPGGDAGPIAFKVRSTKQKENERKMIK
jgi:hypothetical protein